MTERRRTEARIKEALRDLEAPDEAMAEERGRQVVEAAFSGREPVAARPRLAMRAGVALLAGLAVAGFALTPAGAEVREWIGDRFEAGEEGAEPKLTSLPAAGNVLVEAPSGVWIARDDGSRRRLGDYDHATWSPNGQFVAVTDGNELRAVDPLGEFRWSITAPSEIEGVDWSTDEGYRLAYVSGGEVRVVAGDGTDDHGFAAARAVTPAWQPEDDAGRAVHRLTYVSRNNRIVHRDTDTGRVLWRSAEFYKPVTELEWSNDGERLLVEADYLNTVFAADGASAVKGITSPLGVGGAAISPEGEVAFVRRGEKSLALVLASVRGEQILYRAQSDGRGVGSPVFSPDGKWILLPWRAADQWLFVSVNDGRVQAVADITRQFSSGKTSEAFPLVAGWCCTP